MIAVWKTKKNRVQLVDKRGDEEKEKSAKAGYPSRVVEFVGGVRGPYPPT